MACGLLNQRVKEEGSMETIIEIVHHTGHLKSVLQVELFSYISLITLTIFLGAVSAYMRRA
jgi:hypothetical protein